MGREGKGQRQAKNGMSVGIVKCNKEGKWGEREEGSLLLCCGYGWDKAKMGIAHRKVSTGKKRVWMGLARR